MKIITPFPEFRQTFNYDCGAQTLHAVLVYYGINTREDEVMKKAHTTTAGTSVVGMKKAARSFGLKVISGEMEIEEIKKYIDKSIPVIINLQAWTEDHQVDWEKDWHDGHWAVAIGYDKEKLYFEDPSTNARDYLTYNELEKRWHGADGNKKYMSYGIVVYGKKKPYHPDKAIHMD